MLEREAEEKCINELVGAVIAKALDDLYRPYYTLETVPPSIKLKEAWVQKHNLQIFRNRVDARNFFEKSNLFKLTKLSYQALKEQYKRIYNITDEQERKLFEEGKKYVNKQENLQSDPKRSESTKEPSKATNHTRGKLRSGSKQRKRSSK